MADDGPIGNVVPTRAVVRMQQVMLTAVLLLASMLLGLLGQALIAFFFGAGERSDALFFARDVSDLATKLLLPSQAAGVLVPLFLTLRGGRGVAAANHAISGVLVAFGLIALPLVLVVEAAAPWIVGALAPGFSSSTRDLATDLVRLIAPTMWFSLMAVLSTALLQARERFGRAMLCGLAMSATLLVALPLLVHVWGVHGAALAMTISVAIQAAVGWGFLIAEGLPPIVSPWKHRNVIGEVRRRLAPFLGYGAASQLSGIVLRMSLSTLNTGLYTVFSLATRLYRSLLSLLLTPVQYVLLPALARSEAEGDRRGADAELVATLRQMAFLIAPLVVMLFVLRTDVTSVVFERGEFNASDTGRTADTLGVYAFVLLPAGAYLLLEQTAYARRATKLVVRTNVTVEFIQAALYFPLAHLAGATGLAAAAGAASLAAVGIYLRSLRPEVPASLGALSRFGVALATALAAEAVVAVVVRQLVTDALDPEPGLARVVVLIPTACAGVLAYLSVILLMRVREPYVLGATLRGLRRGTGR